jgi:hypothetical protein
MKAETIQNFAVELVAEIRESPEWEKIRNETLVAMVVDRAAKKIVGAMTLERAIDAAIAEICEEQP